MKLLSVLSATMLAGLVTSSRPAQAQTTTRLNPVADTHVRGGSYASRNYGRDPFIPLLDINGVDPEWMSEGFVRFDLSTIPGPITSAKMRINLRMFGRQMGDVNDPTTRHVREMHDNWDEMTMTWDTKPTPGPIITAFTGTARGWMEIDLTTYMQAVQNGDKMASLHFGNTGGDLGWLDFYAKDDRTRKPELVVLSGPGTPQPMLSVTNPIVLPTFIAGDAPTMATANVSFSGGMGGAWTVMPGPFAFFTVVGGSGTGNGTFTLQANPMLPAGAHSGTVVVSAGRAMGSPATSNVTLEVTNRPAPGMDAFVLTASVTLPTYAAGATPSRIDVDVKLSRSSTIAWTAMAATSTTPFFTVSNGMGSGDGKFTLVGERNLAEGRYSGHVLVASDKAINSPVMLPVALSVGPKSGNGNGEGSGASPGGRGRTGGCDCTAGGHPTSGGWATLILLLGLTARRRARSGSR